MSQIKTDNNDDYNDNDNDDVVDKFSFFCSSRKKLTDRRTEWTEEAWDNIKIVSLELARLIYFARCFRLKLKTPIYFQKVRSD